MEDCPLANGIAEAGEKPKSAAFASEKVPRHVAIIMDGNGRWAKARHLPRALGHREGVEALRRTVAAAADLGIEYLSVFGFSSENWRRPKAEVDALFDLLRLYVDRDLEKLARDGVRIRMVGSRDGLPTDVVSIMERAESKTSRNSKLVLSIAFNYGARQEIVAAVKKLAELVEAGAVAPATIDEMLLQRLMGWSDIPDPDLLIRTSGEHRLSNFMLWQSAYTEFVFVQTHWPDFGAEALSGALQTFAERERRFGGHGANS
jgi:undecaprenyl diphosphate synthase